jgi:glycosyltransferase involved in cell wall biosynthesis
MRISLVIPAYDEQAYLPQLLASVQTARQRYIHGADAIEVIVADNVSTDRTAEIAKEYGCQVAAVEKRCIAAARNGGAAAAQGAILCYIDADSRIAPETFNVIDQAMGTGKVAIGATGVIPDRMSAGIRVALVVGEWLGRLMDADTGVVFCRREDFLAVGGYDESRLAAEDLDLLYRLKAYGGQQGRRFVRLPAVKAVTSTRKFDKLGEWHALPMLIRVGWQMRFDKKAFERSARNYWYEDR